MERFSFKSLLIIIVVLLVGIVGLWQIQRRAKPAEAGWFNESWQYRRSIGISNPSGSNLTDFQVSVNIGTSALIAAGKMKSDCSDIRFTDQNGKLLDYWIEESPSPNICNTSVTRIWVKVPTINTSGSNLYIYYGNPSATNIIDGNKVFLFFDNFSTGDTSQWVSESGITLSTPTESGNKVLYISSVNGGMYGTFAGSESWTDYKLMVSIKAAQSRAGIYVRRTTSSNTDSGYYFRNEASNFGRLENHNIPEIGIGTYPQANLTWYEAQVSAIGTTINLTVGDTNINIPRYTTNSSGKIGFCTVDNMKQIWIDNVRVAKVASSDPISTLSATEELSPAPIAYWKFDEGVGTSVFDSSSNKIDGNIGTGGSAPAWATEDQCISNKCLYFNGDGDSFGTKGFEKTLTGLTAEIWIKSNTTAIGGYSRIMSTSSWYPGFIMAVSDTNKFRVYLWDDAEDSMDSTTSINDNNWHHIAFTINTTDGKFYLYVDGKQDKYKASTIDTPIITTNKIIAFSSDREFNGWIDEPKIYAYARTPAQIKQDYNAGKARASSKKGAGVAMGGSTASLSDGLVGYWKMDEGVGTTTADSSGNNNNGTFGTGGSAPSWSTGKYGIGISFDGNDFINCGTNPSLNITNTLTISLWFKSGILSNEGLFGNWSSYNGYLIWGNSNKIAVAFAGNYTFSTMDLNDNLWHFVTATYENGRVKLYIDGVYDNTSLQTLNPTTNAVYIGTYQDPGSTSYSFDGQLDEIRLYNRALTAEEVKDLYEYAPGPIAYYNFDENIGTTAYDRSGNGYNMSLKGTTSWAKGKIGGGISTNIGTSTFTEIPNTNSLIFPALTLTGWFKINSNNGSWWKGLIARGANSTNGFGIAYNSASNFIFRIYTSSLVQRSVASPVPVNQWFYATLVYDGAYMYSYINGIQQYKDAQTGQINASGANIRLGDWDNDYTDKHIDANFDEVKIYNYARTQKQIIEDMNGNQKAINLKSPYLYFSFDDIVGGIGATFQNTGLSRSSYPYSFAKNGFTEAADVGTSADFIHETSGYRGSYSNDFYNGWTVKALSGSAVGQTSIVNDYVVISANNDKQFFLASPLTGFTSGDQYKVFYQTDQSARPEINDCVKGKCVYLDGNDDYLVLNSFSPATVAPTFTVSFWLKPQKGSVGLQNQNGPIMSSIGSNYSLGINIHDGLSYSNFTTKANVLTANKWQYLAYSYDQNNLKIYVNGIGITTRPLTVSVTTGGQIYFGVCTGGGEYTGPGSYYQGYLDEIKIYNYALTDEEIKLDYNQGSQFVMGQSNQTIGGTTTSLEYCLPGDTSYCAPPIAEYKFDENIGTTAYDTSGNNRNLLINGGTWAPGPNNKGSSIKLGQDQYASNDWTDFTLNNQTIEFWFKANQLTGAYQDLVGTHFNSDMNRFHLNSGTNAIIWYNAVSGSSVNSNVVPTVNQWYHVAGTYDGTDRKIYVNGALKNTSTSVGLTDTATGLYVGGTTEDFYGNLSGIKIYNYARTPAQVAWDYNKGKPIGWWKFDECQGNIAYDSSGIGNTGIINIGPSGSQVQLGTCSAGDTSAWSNGKTGKLNSAMSFDGSDDRITLGNPSSLQVAGTKDFSVAAWIYATQNKCGREAVDKSSNTLCGTATNGGWVLGGTTGTLGFHVSDNTNLQYKYLSFSSQLNTWYHLVGVRKGNAVVLYRNGVQIATDDITGFVIDDNKNFSIGGNTTAWIWPGLIDDVRIYNYALTSEQVKQVYNDGAVNFN